MQRVVLSVLAVTLLATAVFSFGGCAEQRPDRSYIQANYIPKSIFNDDEEWYYQPTVIDTPYATSFTFVGEQGPGYLIKWRIEENQLVGYRAWPLVYDSEFDKDRPEKFYLGEPLVSFNILGHFDIQRSYNPTTGEEYNIFEENVVDRLWWEREYMRVDWSQTNVSNYEWFTIENLDTDPVPYYYQGDNPKYAPKIGNDYVDIVTKVVVRPATQYLEGYGDIPMCYFYFQLADCASQEILIRHSFLRRSSRNSDYIPRVYTNKEMDRFGFFTTERKGFDPEYMTTDSKRYYLINRWNIWEKSHNADGSEIPVGERETKTIVYYANEDMPAEFIDASGMIALEYDKAFKLAVNAARRWANNPNLKKIYESELKKKVTDFDYLKFLRELPEDEMKEMLFVFCPHNPVQEGDPPQCGEPGLNPQLGDIRYSFINYVVQPIEASPYGYGPSFADPLTGEIIHAVANFYGWILPFDAQRSLEWIKLYLGELSVVDYILGNHVRRDDGVEEYEVWDSLKFEPDYINQPVLDAEDWQNAIAKEPYKRVQSALVGTPPITANYLSDEWFKQTRRLMDYFVETGAIEEYHSRDAVMQRMWNSEIGDRLLTGDVLMAYGYMPDTKITPELRKDIYNKLIRTDEFRQLRNQVDQRLMSKHCYYSRNFADADLVGVAAEMAVKYKGKLASRERDREIQNELMKRIYFHVTEHEVGHTVGLRHNFRASYDAMNYFDEYWQIRNAKPGDDIALGCEVSQWGCPNETVGPRAPVMNPADPRYGQPVDPITMWELRKNINEYQYSSTMEYGLMFNSQWHGLGKWDYAAIKYGYTNFTEIFGHEPPEPANAYDVFRSAGWGSPVYGLDPAIHYTDLTRLFGDLTNREDVPSTYIVDRIFHRGWGEDRYERIEYLDIIDSDGNVVKDKDNNAVRPIYNDYGDPIIPIVNEDGEDYCQANGIEGCKVRRRPVVPYGFCSDEYSGSGTTCNIWDAGADAFEVIDFITRRYRQYYIYDNFKRNKLIFSPWGDEQMVRTYDRYLRYYLDFYRYYNLYAMFLGGIDNLGEIYPDYKNFTAKVFNDPKGFGGFQSATVMGFETLLEILNMPEPGDYWLEEKPDGTKWWALTWGQDDIFGDDYNSLPTIDALYGDEFSVPLIMGRYFQTTWDFSYGYWFIDQVLYRGSFYDKWLAIQTLTAADAAYIGRDNSVDSRRYNISFYNIFAPELQSFLRASLSADLTKFAPLVLNSSNASKRKLKFTRATAFNDKLPDDAIPMNPKVDFTLKLYLASMMAANYGFNYDIKDRGYANLDIYDLLYLWVSGSGDQVDVAEGNVKSFVEPDTGWVYKARSFPNTDGKELGIAAAMIDRANHLKSIMTGDIGGHAVCSADADCVAPSTCLKDTDADKGTCEVSASLKMRAERELKLFVDELKFIRKITRYVTDQYYFDDTSYAN
ncbi:MAG: hypothetical protein Kow0090_17720 [Myxococcota bacterium]